MNSTWADPWNLQLLRRMLHLEVPRTWRCRVWSPHGGMILDKPALVKSLESARWPLRKGRLCQSHVLCPWQARMCLDFDLGFATYKTSPQVPSAPLQHHWVATWWWAQSTWRPFNMEFRMCPRFLACSTLSQEDIFFLMKICFYCFFKVFLGIFLNGNENI